MEKEWRNFSRMPFWNFTSKYVLQLTSRVKYHESGIFIHGNQDDISDRNTASWYNIR